jgi:hypothetical protein
MRLSFNDKESFIEAVGSLRFNNPPSDPSDPGSNITIITPQDSDTNEDIRFIQDNPQIIQIHFKE